MASTYSSNLGIELIGTGDQSGTWGSTTNTNLGTLIEQAISGYVTQAVTTGMDTTITIPNGSSGVARNMYIELTGSGGASTNLIVPANKKLYFIFNNTSSGQVTVKVSGQTGISVPNGKKMILVSNGTDIVTAENYVASLSTDNLSLTGNLTLSGGTANGVLYLNGSKVATSGSALVFDGTNLGVGTATPSARLEVRSANSDTIADLFWAQQYNAAGTDRALFTLQADAANNLINLRSTGTNAGGFTFISGADEVMRLSSSGNLSVGPAGVTGADGISVASGKNFSFGEGSGTSYSNIFRQANSAATIVANGYKYSSTANGFASSISSSWAKAAIAVGVGGGDIRFYTDTATTVANGTDITPTLRATLTAGGNFGIGTTSPSYPLVVSANGAQGLEFDATAVASSPLIQAYNRSGSAYIQLTYSALQHVWQTSGTERARITNGGNFAIGNAITPSNTAGFQLQMQIEGNLPALTLSNTGTSAGKYSLGVTNGAFGFWDNAANAYRYYIDSAGNFGIGTASPVSKLDVRNGFITGGTAAASNGSKLLANYYTAGAIATWGSDYSSAGPVMGYGVWPSTSASGSFVSATTVAATRGAYLIDGASHKWFSGASQTVAIDSAVSMTQAMTLTAAGDLALGATATSGNSERLYVAGTANLVARFKGTSGGLASMDLVNDANKSLGLVVYASTYSGGSSFNVGANGAILGSTTAAPLCVGTYDSQPLLFGTNSIERGRFTADGNFGVGPSTPGYRGHFTVSSGANRDIFLAGVDTVSNGLTVQWNHSTSKIHVRIVDIPTSSAGLPTGTLWNDAGTLKIA